MRLRWPNQVTSYRSALPGIGGPGMNLNKTPDLPSKIYFINGIDGTYTGAAEPSLGPNIYTGSPRWCWMQDQGAGFHKFIAPIASGYCYLGRSVLAPLSRGNMDYMGQTAPDAGFFWRCANLYTMGGSNTRLWHLASWMGDEPEFPSAGLDAEHRDCINMAYSGFIAEDIAMLNCESRFSMDETTAFWNGFKGLSMIRCANYDPLHIPPDFADAGDPNHGPGQDHGYGPIMGGGDPSDLVISQQNLWAHTTDRNPLVASTNYAHVNNIHFNHGRPTVGRGEGMNVQDNNDWNEINGLTMQANCVGNVSVRGWNQFATEIILARIFSSVTPGSTGHSNYNAQIGWPIQPVSQDDYVKNAPVGYLQRAIRSKAWYEGFGSDYAGVLRPFANPLRPTQQELLAYSYLMRNSVGMMPARRYKYSGGLNRIFDQIDAVMRGITPSADQYINRVSDLGTGTGGWDILPAPTVLNPAAPTADHHAPMPLGADRDDILTSGTFSSGHSKAGYTKLRAWFIEQYAHVMGR